MASRRENVSGSPHFTKLWRMTRWMVLDVKTQTHVKKIKKSEHGATWVNISEGGGGDGRSRKCVGCTLASTFQNAHMHIQISSQISPQEDNGYRHDSR